MKGNRDRAVDSDFGPGAEISQSSERHSVKEKEQRAESEPSHKKLHGPLRFLFLRVSGAH
jgi:hypothetical protein